jgi:hypothetical protein
MQQESFLKLGEFNVGDAERIMRRFEEANIRCQIDADDSRLRNMSPFTASLGGYWGGATMMVIFVPRDDVEKARQLLVEVLKVST